MFNLLSILSCHLYLQRLILFHHRIFHRCEAFVVFECFLCKPLSREIEHSGQHAALLAHFPSYFNAVGLSLVQTYLINKS
uniref:Putative secreted protein n=1 Tax=Xenopsylla cheopis TaxID=163159 RepID=A0A6M2DW47_XENCH